MLHFIRFAAGVITGVVAMQLIKNKSTRTALEKTQDRLREVTVSSLQAIENASARARTQLASDSAEIDTVIEPAAGNLEKIGNGEEASS